MILQRGDISGFQAVTTQRIAGYDVDAVVTNLSREIARNVSQLHEAGLVHYDLKLRNILVKSNKKDGYKVGAGCSVQLCDLDASAPIGSLRRADDKIGSSAYYAPEVARWNVALKRDDNTTHKYDEQLRNTPALDAWSFGVILYELCTGQNLFPARSERR